MVSLDRISASIARMAFAIATAIAALVVPSTALAQASDTAVSEAEILNLLTLQSTADLDFGVMTVGNLGGTVSIDPTTNVRSSLGDVIPIGSTSHRGEFTTNGVVGVLMVMAGDPNVTLVRFGGSETMNANLSYQAGNGVLGVNILGSAIGLFPVQPTQTINVGGTLFVNANQAPGFYQGQFQLTVAYF